MVDVFLSWSGKIGKDVAEVLFDWLPDVIQEIDPFISTGIAKGMPWESEVDKSLQDSGVGVIIVTKDSLTSPWLHYEAGALSQRVQNRKDPRVATFLHKLAHDEVQPPLSNRQGTLGSSKEDVFKFIQSIYGLCNVKLNDLKLRGAFERVYPDLEERLSGIPETAEEESSELIKGVEPAEPTIDLGESFAEISRKVDRLARTLELVTRSESAVDMNKVILKRLIDAVLNNGELQWLDDHQRFELVKFFQSELSSSRRLGQSLLSSHKDDPSYTGGMRSWTNSGSLKEAQRKPALRPPNGNLP